MIKERVFGITIYLMKMKQYLYILILGISLIACEEEVFWDFEVEQKISVNCVLNPDSTVRLSAFYSRNLNENGPFAPVAGARVKLFEDGVLWGNGEIGTDGYFYLASKPIEGKTYALELCLEGEPLVTAETRVQEKPDISSVVRYGKEPTDENKSRIDTVEYTLKDRVGEDYYWNYVLFWYSPKEWYIFNGSLSYVSPYIDDFNRVMDVEEKNGFDHAYYVRLTEKEDDGKELCFSKEFAARKRIDVFFNADKHYDKYMKSSLQQDMIDRDDLPFAEPIQIYSNITNGTGIFGSASFTYLYFKE